MSVRLSIVVQAADRKIAPLSLILAAPVHRRVDVSGALAAADAKALIRYNGIRLAVASISLVLVTVLAAQFLTGAGGQ